MSEDQKKEMSEAEAEDRREMLEEAHEHASVWGPEHHATILKSLLDEHNESYKPNEDSEEADAEDEETREHDDANEKKDEGDKREEKDDKEHSNEEKEEGSEEKESDMDKINKFVSRKKD